MIWSWVELATAKTGLESGTLSSVVEQIGGEESVMQFAEAMKNDPSSLMSLLGRDGDGNPVDDLACMAEGLTGKK